MTKKEFVRAVHETLGKGELRTTECAVNAVLAVIERELVNGNTIVIPSFGKFGVREFKEHEGFNPHTKGTMIVAAQRRVYFKPGDTFRRKLNYENSLAKTRN